MEKEKSVFDNMPEWFQEKARVQIKKEIEEEAKGNTANKEAIRSAMEIEADKLLGNQSSDSDDQSHTDKHIYI